MPARAPTWELIVNGRPLPPDYRRLVRSVSVDATIDGADLLEIDAWGWDSKSQDWRILNETVLGPGNSVVVRMGYADGEIEPLQRFRLLGERATYPMRGRPRVQIRGLSAEHRLVEFTSARKFTADQTYEDMAKIIADDHGLDSSGISQGGTITDLGRATVKEKGETDLAFLQRMAWLAGHGPPFVQYDEVFDSDVLYFRTPALDQQAFRFLFTYDQHVAGGSGRSGNLWSFEPELNLAGMPTQVQVTGWDPDAQQVVRITLEIKDGGQVSTVQTGEQVGKIDEAIRSGAELQVIVLRDGQDIAEARKREALSVLHIPTTEGALSYATRWFRTRLEAFMRARATVEGTPGLWVGQIHEFAGVAPTHAGLWEVVGCRHIADARGYRCDLDLVRVIDERASAPEEV